MYRQFRNTFASHSRSARAACLSASDMSRRQGRKGACVRRSRRRPGQGRNTRRRRRGRKALGPRPHPRWKGEPAWDRRAVSMSGKQRKRNPRSVPKSHMSPFSPLRSPLPMINPGGQERRRSLVEEHPLVPGSIPDGF